MVLHLCTLAYFLVVSYIHLTYFNEDKEDVHHMFTTLQISVSSSSSKIKNKNHPGFGKKNTFSQKEGI